MATTFSRLRIHRWRQFSNIDLVFHDRLTVLTGGNGAGKSTLLRILAQHFGWNSTLLATPFSNKRGGIGYSLGAWRKLSTPMPETLNTPEIIGNIGYSNGTESNLVVSQPGGIQYNIEIHSQQAVAGVNIGSHRPVSNYQQINTISANALGSQQAYAIYHQETLNRFQNAYTQFSPIYRMKEAIISMALFGAGNENIEPNEQLRTAYEGFKIALSKVLPKYLGFRDIVVRMPDVVLVTDMGDFIIDASSGGIMSLIDLAWQIFLFSQEKDGFTVVLDEPENHLHPTMQRSILGSLIDTFPQAQFIVATHSPFIVSSVKDSFVYALRHTPGTPSSEKLQRRSVESIRLDDTAKIGTASEILRDVLGVPVTMPEWAENEIKQIASDFQMIELNAYSLADLRGRLEGAGLSEFFSDALKHIVDRHDQAN